MKSVLYTFSDNFTAQLAIDLIPKGLEPIELHSEQEVLSFLEEVKDIKLLVTEILNENFLQKIRALNSELKLFLLFHTSLKPADIMKLSKLGVHALIAYKEDALPISEEIIENIIKNHITSVERRAHVRIQPSDYENIEASIFIKGINRFVHGKLIDISAGGVAIRLNDSLEASILDLDKLYNPVVLHIRGMEVKTLSRLKGKRADMAGFKFENIETKDMHSISTYIHMRLLDNSKKILSELMRNH